MAFGEGLRRWFSAILDRAAARAARIRGPPVQFLSNDQYANAIGSTCSCQFRLDAGLSPRIRCRRGRGGRREAACGLEMFKYRACLCNVRKQTKLCFLKAYRALKQSCPRRGNRDSARYKIGIWRAKTTAIRYKNTENPDSRIPQCFRGSCSDLQRRLAGAELRGLISRRLLVILQQRYHS